MFAYDHATNHCCFAVSYPSVTRGGGGSYCSSPCCSVVENIMCDIDCPARRYWSNPASTQACRRGSIKAAQGAQLACSSGICFTHWASQTQDSCLVLKGFVIPTRSEDAAFSLWPVALRMLPYRPRPKMSAISCGATTSSCSYVQSLGFLSVRHLRNCAICRKRLPCM